MADQVVETITKTAQTGKIGDGKIFLAMGSVGDIADVSRIFANTNAAAAGGAVVALILTQVLYKKPDLTMILNGALAGLVSITAEPLTPGLGMATLIGGIGGVIVVFAVPLLDKFKIDDVVGAIPVHLFAGIWGTIAVVLTNSDANLMTQLYSNRCRRYLYLRRIGCGLVHSEVDSGYPRQRRERNQRFGHV
ncbi:putative ammonium transporter [Nymphon striatum]|nr:putative ammonium transporter [Nymphon striatum]